MDTTNSMIGDIPVNSNHPFLLPFADANHP